MGTEPMPPTCTATCETRAVTATRPATDELVGTFVRLAPFAETDLPQLFAAISRADVFAGGYGGGPAGLPADFTAFTRFALDYYDAGPTALPWTVRVHGGPDDGAIVGATWLGELDLERESAHLGATAYAPGVWGTVVNPETKLLLLGLAFAHGNGRVKIQADALNARSRTAIMKLGASFEGVARRDQRRADGTWRDTAIYSVLIDEWPAVRGGLERRVAEWGDAPVRLDPSGPLDSVTVLQRALRMARW
jgi:RimJ/RimL family protein N-acetyltransferase